MLIYSDSCKLIGWMNDSMINEDTLKSPRKIPTTNTQADNQLGMHRKKPNGVTQTVTTFIVWDFYSENWHLCL